MRPYHLPCAFLLVLALAAPGYGQVTLEWKLKKDDTFLVETASTCENTLEALGKQAKQSVERGTQLTFKVLEKTGDKTVLEERFELMLVAPHGEAVANRVSTQLKNSQFKVTLDSAMRVKEFEGYQNLLRKLAADELEVQGQALATVGALGTGALGTLPTLGYKSETRRTLETLLTEEGLQQSVTDLFAFLPGKPVKPGDTWTQESTDKAGPLGNAKRTTVYKYEGKEMQAGKSVEKITFTGKVALTGGSSAAASLPFQVVKAELKAEDVKGTIYFDPAAGRLIKSETKMTLQGPLTVELGGTKYDATMKMEYTIKSQLLEPKAAPAPTPAPPAAGGQRGQ